jgi:class 3 adenylate cyclase
VGTFNDTFPDNYNNYIGTISEILLDARSDDINLVTGDSYTFAYDISQYNQYVAMFNICRTFFVCILLILTTIFFSSDLEFTAIAPLEEMMEIVRKIALNPLNAIREIEEKNMCLEKLEEEEGREEEITEPRILQNLIVKISSLLAVGFGEAGTEIICKVIEDPTIIDVMIPGQKCMAVFGFCDIRNFTDATEVLEADVMVFVNEIAAICHKEVYECLGNANKNIGDAFLLVWKFNQQDIKVTETEEEAHMELIPSLRVRQMADLAVLSFVKMAAAIARSETLQKYKHNKGLQKRIANYLGVKMGYGLHIGWAIEGPIGSEYKIDASYLGPDVHMASRLEGATKAYGTSMLITDAVYDLMTESRKYLRKIDCVMPEKDAKPMDLYTVDLNVKHLFEELDVEVVKELNNREKRTAKVYQSIARRNLFDSIEKNESTTLELWNDE